MCRLLRHVSGTEPLEITCIHAEDTFQVTGPQVCFIFYLATSTGHKQIKTTYMTSLETTVELFKAFLRKSYTSVLGSC